MCLLWLCVCVHVLVLSKGNVDVLGGCLGKMAAFLRCVWMVSMHLWVKVQFYLQSTVSVSVCAYRKTLMTMCVCVCLCVCVCVCAYVCLCVGSGHLPGLFHQFECVCVCLSVCASVILHTFMDICMCVCVSVSVCVCVCFCDFAYIYGYV